MRAQHHETKGALHAMRMLSYRNVKNTLFYTQLTNLAKTNTFPKVAWTLEEACKLLETGFGYVCEIGGAKIFRKRK
jgi:hypothetical protein